MVFAVWACPEPLADGLAELEDALVGSVRRARAEPEQLAFEASERYGYQIGWCSPSGRALSRWRTASRSSRTRSSDRCGAPAPSRSSSRSRPRSGTAIRSDGVRRLGVP